MWMSCPRPEPSSTSGVGVHGLCAVHEPTWHHHHGQLLILTGQLEDVVGMCPAYLLTKATRVGASTEGQCSLHAAPSYKSQQAALAGRWQRGQVGQGRGYPKLPQHSPPRPIQVPRELSMLNEVPSCNVTLHHLPGHKVVIWGGQRSYPHSILG